MHEVASMAHSHADMNVCTTRVLVREFVHNGRGRCQDDGDIQSSTRYVSSYKRAGEVVILLDVPVRRVLARMLLAYLHIDS